MHSAEATRAVPAAAIGGRSHCLHKSCRDAVTHATLLIRVGKDRSPNYERRGRKSVTITCTRRKKTFACNKKKKAGEGRRIEKKNTPTKLFASNSDPWPLRHLRKDQFFHFT